MNAGYSHVALEKKHSGQARCTPRCDGIYKVILHRDLHTKVENEWRTRTSGERWVPKSDALHPLSSHKSILDGYLPSIELRTVMHFTLRGYPQCDFVSIFKYDWAPNSNALHAPRVSTKWLCNDIWIPLSSHHLARVSAKWFFIDIYIRLSPEQWCTSRSEGIHKLILHWYLHTIELRTVMHTSLEMHAA